MIENNNRVCRITTWWCLIAYKIRALAAFCSPTPHRIENWKEVTLSPHFTHWHSFTMLAYFWVRRNVLYFYFRRVNSFVQCGTIFRISYRYRFTPLSAKQSSSECAAEKKHMSTKEIDFWMGSVKKGREQLKCWKSEFNNRQFPLFGIHQTKSVEMSSDGLLRCFPSLAFLVCTHRASNWRIPTIGPVGLFMSESG